VFAGDLARLVDPSSVLDSAVSLVGASRDAFTALTDPLAAAFDELTRKL
jgi:hypothetical protein